MRTLDVARDPFLERLLAEIDELSAVQRRASVASDRAIDLARDHAALATLRLDGSPIEEVPARVPAPPPGETTGPARASWLDVLRSGTRELRSVPDEVVLAVEHRGARAGLDATDLAHRLRGDARDALSALHGLVTDGLLHPSVVGRLRGTDQAVHDASLGRVLFFPVDRSLLPDRLDQLVDWLASTDDHPVVVSGVLHHQLLDLHPFEAANGRLARIAARLVLSHAGLDESRVCQPEQVLLRDPIGYLDEVSRARRLGDPHAFVVRWAEAVSEALLDAVRPHLGITRDDLPAATRAFLADSAGRDVTIVDHRRAVGGDAEVDADLDLARRVGLVHRTPGSGGLRWEVAASAGGDDPA